MSEDNSSNERNLSRRDFLKVAGTGLGVAALAAGGVVARERFIFSDEHKIDMDNYLSKVKVEGRDEYTINFAVLKTFFPDIVNESEHGGFFLKNESENQITLDFSNAGGKEIRLSPNGLRVAKSNMSWEKAKQDDGFDYISGGLLLEGSFKVMGSIGGEPIFVGDVLDRTINFNGTGTEKCVVEDVIFKGLNAFKQDENGGGDCPDPAFISGDNVNLEINGIKIDYVPVKPDWADETNSQLAKGIILHNTENINPIQLNVSHSIIKGLQWDGICSNGLVQTIVNKSRILQDSSYKQVRGVGVASTFNSPDGNIAITDSEINYCKGTSIWINEKVDSPRQINNLVINDTIISNAGWAISIDSDQKTSIKNLAILPDYNGNSQEDIIYWPIDLSWKGSRFDISFESLNFSLSPEMGDAIKLVFFANWENFNDFNGTTPQEFFSNKFGSWGDIAVKIEGQEFKLERQKFKKFVDEFEPVEEQINPSGVMLWFDVTQKQFAVLFATTMTEDGSINFSEPYYLDSAKQDKSNSNRAITSSRVTKRKGLDDPKLV